jgi:hypothetical protein
LFWDKPTVVIGQARADDQEGMKIKTVKSINNFVFEYFNKFFMIGYFIFVFIEYILTENKIICKAK